MGASDFIKNKFLGKEIAIFVGELAETVLYDQSWASNKEYLQGIIESVDNDIITLNIQKVGTVYINVAHIMFFWEPGFNYIKAVKTSLTKKMVSI
jgi:hypothetical protein